MIARAGVVLWATETQGQEQVSKMDRFDDGVEGANNNHITQN